MVDTVQRRLWKLLEGYLLRAGLSVVPQVYFKAYQVPGTCSAGGREPCEQDTHDHSFMSSWESPACLESYLLSPTRADPHTACMDLALVQMVLEDLDPPRRAGEGHEVGLCGDPEGKGSGGACWGLCATLSRYLGCLSTPPPAQAGIHGGRWLTITRVSFPMTQRYVPQPSSESHLSPTSWDPNTSLIYLLGTSVDQHCPASERETIGWPEVVHTK